MLQICQMKKKHRQNISIVTKKSNSFNDTQIHVLAGRIQSVHIQFAVLSQTTFPSDTQSWNIRHQACCCNYC